MTVTENPTPFAPTPFVATHAATIIYDDAPVPVPEGWPAPIWEAMSAGKISHRRALALIAKASDA